MEIGSKFMINEYVSNWIKIIEQMNNDNTYKLAWGRAIIECVSLDELFVDDENITISFYSIASKMIKYYWNQLFFFQLKQSPYSNKSPIICQEVEKLIDFYKKESGSNIPVWFNVAEEFINKKDVKILDKSINKVVKTLHENVAWRFKNIEGKTIEIYDYAKDRDYISIKKENRYSIQEYSIIISKLLNYKWAQLLEKYNYAPKILSKVNGISEAKIKRNSLSKYKEELLKEFEGKQIIDFYTGKPLSKDNISIDHVIPWSFMYSDDIWNLVITSRTANSKKSNIIPSDEIIERLKERNIKLLPVLSISYKNQMEEAINNNYLDKYYYESRI